MGMYNAEQFDGLSHGNLNGLTSRNELVLGKRFPVDDVMPCGEFKRRKQLEASEELSLITITDRSPASVLSGGFTESDEPDGSMAETGIDVPWNDQLSVPAHTLVHQCDGESISPPAWTSYFPECSEKCRPTDEEGDSEYELDSPMKREVLIGLDHQALIPDWRPRVRSGMFGRHGLQSSSLLGIDADDAESEKWISNTVMPRPRDLNGTSLAEIQHDLRCGCFDEGSIRCTREHVLDARNELMMNLGESLFNELGLADMGESAALSWSNDEEVHFHEIIYSNPESSGKNFWEELSRAFPERSMHELVNYYFNVFILRRRAQQNRSEHLYIDSDDDELQDGDDDGEAMEEDNNVAGSIPERASGVCSGDAAKDVGEDYVLDEFGEFDVLGYDAHEPISSIRPGKTDIQKYMEDRVACGRSSMSLPPQPDGADSGVYPSQDQKFVRSFYGTDDIAGPTSTLFPFDPQEWDPRFFEGTGANEMLSTNDEGKLGMLGREDFLIGRDISDFFVD